MYLTVVSKRQPKLFLDKLYKSIKYPVHKINHYVSLQIFYSLSRRKDCRHVFLEGQFATLLYAKEWLCHAESPLAGFKLSTSIISRPPESRYAGGRILTEMSWNKKWIPPTYLLKVSTKLSFRIICDRSWLFLLSFCRIDRANVAYKLSIQVLCIQRAQLHIGSQPFISFRVSWRQFKNIVCFKSSLLAKKCFVMKNRFFQFKLLVFKIPRIKKTSAFLKLISKIVVFANGEWNIYSKLLFCSKEIEFVAAK